MIFVRLKGSVTPLRLTTARTASSTVVNRRPHSGHERRRRISWPSSASRESTTLESACRQYGQRMLFPAPHASSSLSHGMVESADSHLPVDAAVHNVWTSCG